MKLFRNILIFVLSIVFLVSATGILIFHTHCACTGNDQVSVYVSPETCEDSFHVHHTHGEGGEEVCVSEHECHECTTHTDNCGCDAPEVRFLKLDDRVVNEKVRIEKILPAQLHLMAESAILLFHNTDGEENQDYNYIDPPPLLTSSKDFLILIQQLKIPVSA